MGECLLWCGNPSHSLMIFILTAGRAWKPFPFWYKTTPVTQPQQRKWRGSLAWRFSLWALSRLQGHCLKVLRWISVLLYNYCDTGFSLLVHVWQSLKLIIYKGQLSSTNKVCAGYCMTSGPYCHVHPKRWCPMILAWGSEMLPQVPSVKQWRFMVPRPSGRINRSSLKPFPSDPVVCFLCGLHTCVSLRVLPDLGTRWVKFKGDLLFLRDYLVLCSCFC
jgi:hypothetical protein